VYKHILITLTAFAIVSSLAQTSIVQAAPYTNITAKTACQAITSGICPNLVILDVRTREEFDQGHIRKALLIPHSELEQRIDELTEHMNHEIIVYCFCGMRSTIACGILDAHGFKKVYNMVDGINAWTGQGYPITTSYSTQISFTVSPNPAKTGQRVFLNGIMVDQFSNPVANQNVQLYYREKCSRSPWRFALAVSTAVSGEFAATGDLHKPGVYEVCAFYPGAPSYEASHRFEVLLIRP
jgi:rhodanese-related sulfurtransferase